MNYELAHELKEAGFPQKPIGTGGLYIRQTYSEVFCNCDVCENEGQAVGYSGELIPKDAAYAPTLGELIEACGAEFGKLIRIEEDDWNAVSDNWKDEAHGPTPEEAVARLWLALNKTP